MPQLVFSNKRGSVFVHPHLKACGMKGGSFFKLDPKELIKIPKTSRLFMLPQRMAVGYDETSGCLVSCQASAVAAFMSPGHTTTYNSAYIENLKPKALPLFSYAAAAFHKGSFYAASVMVDRDIRHDHRFIDIAVVRKNARSLKKRLSGNRLIQHLERCALVYGCPNAQNFFLKRCEAPLPSAPHCNAACAGCISYQKSGSCAASQPRIQFVPRPEELAEIALLHIENVPNAIVSFGQGCEGEPLTQGSLIEKSIRLIRKAGAKGVININTNGSKPQTIRRLAEAGLDSVRISMNSCREKYYNRYYRPRGYSFRDVLKSVDLAKRAGLFVSINYLTMPGFTDSIYELTALRSFLDRYRADMVQWRNLNYDPVRYFKAISADVRSDDMVGIREEIALLKKEFPHLRMGYFNPFIRRSSLS